MNYFIDSYAWIEYLDGSVLGEKVDRILKGDNNVYTLALNISEVVSMVKRKDGNVELAYKAMMSNCKVIGIDSKVAKEAGVFHAKMRGKVKDFGIVDSLIYIVARRLKSKIVTGDKHFKRFKESVFLK